MKCFAVLAFVLLGSATAAWAQDEDLDQQVEQALEKFRRGRKPKVEPQRSTQDDERVKRIVDRIEKEIRDSHDRTREEIRAIIRAEIQKNQGKAVPAPAPQAPGRKVYLGITAEDMSDTERKTLGVGGGIKVADVRGPAKDAGLKAGDILVELDGEAVTEERIGEILSRHKPGDAIEAAVIRSKKRVALTVTLGERKD